MKMTLREIKIKARCTDSGARTSYNVLKSTQDLDRTTCSSQTIMLDTWFGAKMHWPKDWGLQTFMVLCRTLR